VSASASSGRALVRDARGGETRAIAAALTQSFHDDPVQRFLFPEERAYQRRGRRNFELVTARILDIGVVHVTDGLEGAALWLPPGGDLTAGLGGALFGLRSVLAMGPALRRGARLLQELARRHPHEPHWYLPVLGTVPAHQRRGLGSALLAPVLARCDAEGLPAYLESSKAKNVPFYRRHGFEVVGESLRVPDGPELWPMLRPPRP
jgi:GNAT superfamily N-acetyltransferase